jgi:hypothetical protein
LLRKLCIGFPERFAELHALAHADIEVDFFANVAHLQMHRRTRALHRLVKFIPPPPSQQSHPLLSALYSAKYSQEPDERTWTVARKNSSLRGFLRLPEPDCTIAIQAVAQEKVLLADRANSLIWHSLIGYCHWVQNCTAKLQQEALLTF